MCPLGYSEGQAGLAAGVLILAGLVGSFILGPLARRRGLQLEVTKVAMPLSAMGGILCVMALRFADFYWAILLALAGFSFAGLGSFPIILELAVEVIILGTPWTVIERGGTGTKYQIDKSARCSHFEYFMQLL